MKNMFDQTGFDGKFKSKLFLLLTLLLVSALALSACGGTQDQEPLEEPAAGPEGTTLDEESPVVEEAPGVVEETPLVEEGAMEETPMAEEGVVEETPMAQEDVVEETPMAQEGVVEETPMAQQGAEPGMTEEGAPGALGQANFRASELIGNDVMGTTGDNIGQVEEIVVGLNNNVDYAILTSDEGLLDIGADQMVAVPLSSLQAGTEADTYQFTGDPLVFETAPTFTEEQWASLADPTWDDSFFDFWQSQEEMALMPETGGEAAVTGPAFVRASEMLDQEVVNTAGEDIGNVEDLVLNPQPNTQDYAVMSFEGFEEIGPDQLYAIPLNELNFTDVQGDNLFTYDADPTTLQNLPSFTADTWPMFTNPAAGVPGAAGAMAAGERPPLRISEVTGDGVLNANGEDLGQIRDVVIGLQNNTDYGIVALEQSLFDLTDETLVAIPMTALHPTNAEAEAFSFAGDQSILQNAPTFTEEQWENMIDPTWDDEFFEFWEEEGLIIPPGVLPTEAVTGTTTTTDTTAAAPGEMQGAAFVSASGLMDQDVLDAAGEVVGNVQDVILSGQQNGTDYAVMSFDIDELGGNLYLVPVDQLSFSTTAEGDNVLTFNVDPTIMQNAPIFNEDDWENFITNPTWDEEFQNFWGTEVAQ